MVLYSDYTVPTTTGGTSGTSGTCRTRDFTGFHLETYSIKLADNSNVNVGDWLFPAGDDNPSGSQPESSTHDIQTGSSADRSEQGVVGQT